MNPQEVLMEKIRTSSDETLGKGTHFHSKAHLGHISFSNFMDIVLYLVSLQSDWREITKIRSWDFYDLLKNLWREKREEIYKIFPFREPPWSKGPDPMAAQRAMRSSGQCTKPVFFCTTIFWSFSIIPRSYRVLREVRVTGRNIKRGSKI